MLKNTAWNGPLLKNWLFVGIKVLVEYDLKIILTLMLEKFKGNKILMFLIMYQNVDLCSLWLRNLLFRKVVSIFFFEKRPKNENSR